MQAEEFLNNYERVFPDEFATVQKFRTFLQTAPKPFERRGQMGHFTASAMVINEDMNQIVLAHHRKLKIWIPLGGHADGETNLLKVAFQEVEEESGIKASHLHPFPKLGFHTPFDLDHHQMQTFKNTDCFEHFDFTFVFISSQTKLVLSDESFAIKWVPIDQVDTQNDASLFRKIPKLLKFISEIKN